MSTKNTQNTEDMLDQTFANFDSQVTGIEEEVSNKKPVAATGGKSNMMLFIAAGIAAVGAIAYIVVIKGGMLDGGQPAPVQPQAQVAPANPSQPVIPPVDNNAPQLPGATPTVPPVDASNPAVPGLPQAPQLPGSPAIPVPPVVDATAPVVPPAPPVDASVPTAPVIPEVKVDEAPQVAPTIPKVPEVKVEVPVANTSVPSLPAVKIDNLKAIGVKPSAGVGSESSASIMLAEELKSMFERQTSEFKTELTDVSTRVGAIESAVTEQKDINKKVEERLVKLENGAVVPAGKSKLEAIKIKSAKQAEESASKEEEEKPVVKQKYSKKKEVAVAKKVKPTTTKKEVKPTSVKEEAKETKDDSLLIDKSEPSAPVSVKKSKEKEVVKVNMPKIEVHSIYGGRAWVKNADGSLATYEVGDTLPTGEKIKKVNDDAFEIVTDKRTISK